MKICCSYRSAVPPHQRTAVQFMAKCIAPVHSAAVQHRLAAGLCLCNHTCEDSYSNHTYEDLLFIQVCSPTTPAHCSTNHGKMHCPTAQCFYATQADGRLVPAAITPVKIHTAITPMKICCSYRSAVPPHQRTAVQIMAKCIAPVHSAAVQHRLAAGLCQCNHTCEDSYSNHTYEDLLFIQVCSPTTPVHAVQFLAKCIAPVHSAAVQHRLAAGLCLCNHTCEDSYSNHTYEDLLFIQVCSPTTPAHCSTNHGKMHCPTAQCFCATQADSRLVPLQSHL